MTAVGGNASVYQAHPVSYITGQERAEVWVWGPRIKPEGAAGETGGATQYEPGGATIYPLTGQI